MRNLFVLMLMVLVLCIVFVVWVDEGEVKEGFIEGFSF